MKVLKATRSGTHPHRWRLDLACGHGGSFVTSMKPPELTEVECPAGCESRNSMPADAYEKLWDCLRNAGHALEATEDAVSGLAKVSGCYHSGGGISFLCGHCEKAYRGMEAALRALGCKAVAGVWCRSKPVAIQIGNTYQYTGEMEWIPIVPPSDSAEIIRAQRGPLDEE